MGEGAVGEVYQVIHKPTCSVYALKRVSRIQAQQVSLELHFILPWDADDVIKLQIRIIWKPFYSCIALTVRQVNLSNIGIYVVFTWLFLFRTCLKFNVGRGD